MTTLKSFYIFCFFLSYITFTFAQSNAIGMAIVTEKITKETSEITATDKLLYTPTNEVANNSLFKAEVWPNPSNLGKVRLSVENLPSVPLHIQIFNHKEELIQEGVIQGTIGEKLEHTLILPDNSGHYSIKLSNTHKFLKDLSLEIL